MSKSYFFQPLSRLQLIKSLLFIDLNFILKEIPLWGSLIIHSITGGTPFFRRISLMRQTPLSPTRDSKLNLVNSQNASAFNNLRVRKISTCKRLQVRIIHVYQTLGKNVQVV